MTRKEITGRILLLEHNKQHIELIRSSLKNPLPGLKIDAVATLATALKRLKEKEYQLILSEIVFKNTNGHDLIAALKRAAPQTPLLIITGKGSDETPAEVIQSGADDYITKSRESLKALPHLIEKILLRRKFTLASFTNVPVHLVQRLGSELDLLFARSHMIAKNATNAEMLDGIQDQITKLKKLAQKIIPT